MINDWISYRNEKRLPNICGRVDKVIFEMNKCTKLKGLRCPAPSMVGGSVHCMLPAVYKCNSHLYICKSHLYGRQHTACRTTDHRRCRTSNARQFCTLIYLRYKFINSATNIFFHFYKSLFYNHSIIVFFISIRNSIIYPCLYGKLDNIVLIWLHLFDK